MVGFIRWPQSTTTDSLTPVTPDSSAVRTASFVEPTEALHISSMRSLGRHFPGSFKSLIVTAAFWEIPAESNKFCEGNLCSWMTRFRLPYRDLPHDMSSMASHWLQMRILQKPKYLRLDTVRGIDVTSEKKDASVESICDASVPIICRYSVDVRLRVLIAWRTSKWLSVAAVLALPGWFLKTFILPTFCRKVGKILMK